MENILTIIYFNANRSMLKIFVFIKQKTKIYVVSFYYHITIYRSAFYVYV